MARRIMKRRWLYVSTMLMAAGAVFTAMHLVGFNAAMGVLAVCWALGALAIKKGWMG